MMRLLLSSLLTLLLSSTFCAAEPQINNNAPFSGIVYIVDPNGQPVSSQSTNLCPNQAPVSCGSVGQPSYCCPNSYTCASPSNSNGLLGCCPVGSSCGGSVNVASVTTVTVYAQAHQPTSFVLVNPPQSTVVVYKDPPPTHQAGFGYQDGFCATITMTGPGLPTTRQGDCGVVLVVGEGAVNFRALGVGTVVVGALLHLALGRMFGWM